MGFTDIISEIKELKEKHNALILAHYYEDGDIQDLADVVGDSLYLAQQGEKADNPVVLMCGVVFMGESVKILSPNKKVIVPDMDAGCSLVHGSPYDEYLKWRLEHPEAIVVTYVNSSAAVKTISDVVCTSSNAEKIIAAIPEDREILFGPDKHLGRYIAGKTGRDMKLWQGACEVHVLFSAKAIYQLKKENPNAVVLAHPECMDAVLEQADVIGSTSRLLQEVREGSATEFIVATEAGILHQMQKVRPEAKLIPAPAEGGCACNNCPYMKLNTLEKIRDSLKSLSPEVTVEQDVLEKAQISLRRMMDITDGKPVTWPTTFTLAGQATQTSSVNAAPDNAPLA